MTPAHDVQALLENLAHLSKARSSGGLRLATHRKSPGLELSWPGLEEILPDGGLPRGVVELSAPSALGGSTTVALEAVRAGQARSNDAWCAWIDPEATLHAPGVASRGIDLARMLVIRPPRAQLGRVAVKLMAAGAFEVVVVDFDAIPGASRSECHDRDLRDLRDLRDRRDLRGPPRGPIPRAVAKRKAWAPEVLVRKLALAAESTGATVLLLTDASRPRAQPWPVSLRLELSRPRLDAMAVRIAKDRRGRIGMVKTVAFPPLQTPAAG